MDKKNVLLLTLRRELSLKDAVIFGLARYSPKPVSFSINGIYYENIDRTHWGVLANSLINRVYFAKELTIKNNVIVIDIGAHRGTFTMSSSKNYIKSGDCIRTRSNKLFRT